MVRCVYISVLSDPQVGQEYEIQRIVKRDSCIPVAEVLHLSTAAEENAVGAKFMVMKFVKVNKMSITLIVQAIISCNSVTFSFTDMYYECIIKNACVDIALSYALHQEYVRDLLCTLDDTKVC